MIGVTFLHADASAAPRGRVKEGPPRRGAEVGFVQGQKPQLAERLAVTVAVDRAVLDPEDAVEAAAEPVRDLARDSIRACSRSA